MSEEIPGGPEASDEPKGKPRKEAKPVSERDADIARLAQLQKDYDQLRDQVKNAPTPAAGVGAEALAKKVAVAREITVLKQKLA